MIHKKVIEKLCTGYQKKKKKKKKHPSRNKLVPLLYPAVDKI